MRLNQILAVFFLLVFITGSGAAGMMPYELVRDADQTGDDFTRIPKTENYSSDALVEKGNSAYAEGNLKSAVTFYGQAIEKSFLNATAYFNRATAYVQLSKLELAILDFTYVLQLTPDYVPALHARSVAYRRSNNLIAAMKDHDLAVKLQPYSPALLHNRALTLTSLGRLDEAVADLTKAIDQDVNFVPAYNARAKAYYRLGAYLLALGDYSKVSHLDSTDMNAAYNSALVLIKLGKFEASEEVFSIVLGNNPDHLLTLISRAELRGSLGNKKDALSDINRAIKIDPTSKQALQIRNFLHTQN